MRAWRRLGPLTFALVALVDGAVAGTSVSVAQTSPSVTPAEAKNVVETYAQANATNNEKLDSTGQGTIEGPPLQTIDAATYRDAEGRGLTTLGQQVKVDKIRVYVPKQSAYPLQFLASYRVTPPQDGEQQQQLLVFVRASEAEPWRVTMAAQLAPGLSPPKIATSSDGLATIVDAQSAGSLREKPELLAAGLSELFNRLIEGKKSANRKLFAPGPLTTEVADRMAQQVRATRKSGAGAQLKFEPAQFAPVAYRSAKRSAIVLFVLALHEAFDPAAGRSLPQPASQDAFGGLVAPGQYAAVRIDRLAIFAAWVPESRTKHAVEVIAIYEGVVQALAVPAPPGSSAGA